MVKISVDSGAAAKLSEKQQMDLGARLQVEVVSYATLENFGE